MRGEFCVVGKGLRCRAPLAIWNEKTSRLNGGTDAVKRLRLNGGTNRGPLRAIVGDCRRIVRPGIYPHRLLASRRTTHCSLWVHSVSCERSIPWSGAAKRLAHDLIGLRRIGETAELRLFLVGGGEGRNQTIEDREIISVHGRGDRLFHRMIARNEKRVRRAHQLRALVVLVTLLGKPMPPPQRPIVKGARRIKEGTHSRVTLWTGSRVAQPPKG